MKIDSTSQKRFTPKISSITNYSIKNCVFLFSSGVDRAGFDPLLHLGQVHPHHE
jgi:hypothetical protein